MLILNARDNIIPFKTFKMICDKILGILLYSIDYEFGHFTARGNIILVFPSLRKKKKKKL